jgi:hypothetical protein
MKLSISINKRMMVLSLCIVALVLASALIHKAYAGKSRISLNSPVSFPVDI